MPYNLIKLANNALLFLIFAPLLSCSIGNDKIVVEKDKANIEQLLGIGYDAIVYDFILHKCPPHRPSDKEKTIVCPESYVFLCDSIFLYDKSELIINGEVESMIFSKNDIPTFREPILISNLTDENGDFILKDFSKCSVSMQKVVINGNKANIEGSNHSSEDFFEYTLYFLRENRESPWRYVKGEMGGFN